MARTSGLDGGLGLQPLPPSLTTPSGTAGLPPVAKGWGLDLEPAVSPKWPHPSEGSWGGRYLRAESLGCPRPQRRPNASAGPRACWGLGGQLCSCLISLLAPALPPASEGRQAREGRQERELAARGPPNLRQQDCQPFGSGSWGSPAVWGCVWGTLSGLLPLTSVTETPLPFVLGT